MTITSANLKASSIRVTQKMYDILKPQANFISQIPQRFLSIPTTPSPYFIFEQLPLERICEERKALEFGNITSKHEWKGDREIIDECVAILGFIEKEQPVLIYISLG